MSELKKKIRFGVDWRNWQLLCRNDWYDGPFFEIQIGPFWCLFNKHGLPYIFQGDW